MPKLKQNTPKNSTRDEKGVAGAQTLFRGLDVMDLVQDGPMTLNELSEQLGLTRSTAHRLATALTERRFLSFKPREGYSLGPRILELGHCARQQVQLTRTARPFLDDLARATSDIVHLGVLFQDEVLYLDKIPGRRRILISSHVGERQPVATTGLGKALILDETEERWRQLFRLNAYKPSSSLPVWLDRMRAYVAGGYALDLEENEDRVRCVSAPIRDVEGSIVAAVSVSSAAQYMDDERMGELIPLVKETTYAISRELGWRPTPEEMPSSA
ncbi:IclR family transcriptional regulator [Parvularcula dongshanensis]|uniref:DNA-binding IclR family transcriptional regulator n=1 Tax=Parvularcula dongshanensis TaxID=1173995 RepID=A0A840I5H5_9PROT|nr:IclR family transcriptional regulator [Parvularcula dongshanensis]MBB4659575.1 DNA-binding IclR family transcriptional regulator [Parvularcula dongshanensis]